MLITELHKIKALGNLLRYYHSDLTYILNFQRFKQKIISESEYLRKTDASFQSFLNEFRVARNVHKEKVVDLLHATVMWVHEAQADDVDLFADELREKGITQEKKTMTSLASKLLFLNNPWTIFPCDTRNRRAIGVETSRYSDFRRAISYNIEGDLSGISYVLEPVLTFICAIENEFRAEIPDLGMIRRNRFLDKLLWVLGGRPILSGGPIQDRITAEDKSTSYGLKTHGHRAKSFRYVLDDASIKIIKGDGGHTENYPLEEVLKIIRWLWGRFGNDWFPLGNNVKKLGRGIEVDGLGVAILGLKPKDIGHAQSASYLGVVLEHKGLLEWNGEQKGIKWRIIRPANRVDDLR